MANQELKVGVCYIVQQGSTCETFAKGERIEVLEDGSILNRTLGACLDAHLVPLAVDGAVFVVDTDRMDRRRASLQKALQWVNSTSL